MVEYNFSMVRLLRNIKSSLSNTGEDIESWTTEKSNVASAKKLALVFQPPGKSVIYTKKNKGSRIESCRTPALIMTNSRIDH